MRLAILLLFSTLGVRAWATPDEIAIPPRDRDRLRVIDGVTVTGTNDLGGQEDFTIHDGKAIRQFTDFLRDDRYVAVPKSLRPRFKSLSSYHVVLLVHGQPALELQIIADSILDLAGEPSYYMEAERHSDNLLAPLLRLR